VDTFRPLRIICLNPEGYSVPALGDGLGTGQSVSLKYSGIAAAVNAPLKTISRQVIVAVTGGPPTYGDSASALDFIRNSDSRGGCGRNVIKYISGTATAIRLANILFIFSSYCCFSDTGLFIINHRYATGIDGNRHKKTGPLLFTWI